MEKQKSVLCPTDFTSVADNALNYAIDFALKIGGNLIVLHIINSSFVATSKATKEAEQSTSGLEKTIYEKLKMLKNDIETEHGISVTLMVEYGKNELVISRIAKEADVELIVIGSLGHTGVNTSFGASGMEKLLDNTIIPVLIIPSETVYSFLDHWLYATDLKYDEDATLHILVKLTSAFNASLEVLYVRQENKKKMEDLHKFTLLLQKYSTGQETIFTEIQNENVLEGIEQYTWETKPDVLIMAKHLRDQLDKLFKREDKIIEMIIRADFPLLVLHEDK